MVAALDEPPACFDDLRDCRIEIDIGLKPQTEMIDAAGADTISSFGILVDRDGVMRARRSPLSW